LVWSTTWLSSPRPKKKSIELLIDLLLIRSAILLSSSGSLTRHALLDGPAKLQEALAHLLDGQLVQRPDTTVAKVVDVVGVGLVPTRTKVEDVADRVEEVLGTQPHFVLVEVDIELSVDTEPTDLADAVAVLVEELLFKQGAGLVDLRRVARTQAAVNASAMPLRVRSRRRRLRGTDRSARPAMVLSTSGSDGSVITLTFLSDEAWICPMASPI
jgi:hypothetical protein